MNLFRSLATIMILFLAIRCFAAEDLQDRLAAAKPGQTIELPAGEFRGGVILPEGISLKGAGFNKTTIDAAGSASGVTISGGKGIQVSDLTIRNAKGTGLAVSKAESLTLARVQVKECPIGFQINQVEKCRIENCIGYQDRFGISVSQSDNCEIINCTVVDCPEMGISLANSPHSVVFNNCIVGCGVCLNIDKPSNVQADHNLYLGLFVGQMAEQGPKKVLSGWQYVTAEDNKPGLDLRSVLTSVEFKNAASGDFSPATVLDWNPQRAATSDWGTSQFVGVKAPQTDINGKSRDGRVDVGVVEVAALPTRASDGEFTISKDEGIKTQVCSPKMACSLVISSKTSRCPRESIHFGSPRAITWVNQFLTGTMK